MTVEALIAQLRQRVARSHTTGGITVVARELGISKQLLEGYLKGRWKPTAEMQAQLVAALKRKG